MVFDYRMLRRIFGPKREEAIEGWKHLNHRDVQNW
jgi:hypothetical protein